MLKQLIEKLLDKKTKSEEELEKKYRSKSEDHIDKQLKIGISVEMEHTNDRKTAEEIARDHLDEDPDYYTKLNKAGL